MLQKRLLFAWVLLCFVTAPFAQLNTDAAKYAGTITAAELKEKLSVIAGPEMEGRETASEGQRKAADYIAAYFKQLGLSPANKGSYFQQFPVYQETIADASLEINGKVANLFQDFGIIIGFTNGGEVKQSSVVFGGYGIYDSAQAFDDFKNISVAGKLVVLLDGAPTTYKVPSAGNNRRTPPNPSMFAAKLAHLKKLGASAVLFVVQRGLPQKASLPLMGNKQFRKQANTANLLAATIDINTAKQLLQQPAAESLDALNELPKKEYSANVELKINKSVLPLESSNVAGFISGTDKKDEYVVLTAHYDHLGKRNGVIYYGADDDGSGTTSVLQMAKAFAEAKKAGKGPRRTVVFMTVSGEENGLWGSQYYSENPLFPLDKTTVNLNTDMVGRVDPGYKGDTSNYVYVIGDDKISSDLAVITDSVNQTSKMELDRRFNDLNDPNRFYYRSDHYNFAKAGVPIIFYFNGVHADYHQPTDTVDKINFSLMEKRVKFIFNTAWAMANRNDFLKRDKPLQIPPR
ncbi:MAG: M28 family peptidase [Chitinophagaceae bacterium]